MKNKMQGAIGVVAIAAIIIFGGLLLGGLALYGYINGLRSEALQLETTLNAQYLDNQNELSTYVSSFYEQVGVANLKSEKMDQILLDAVKGRYEKDGKTVGYGEGTPFFSAIVEAYPDIRGLDIYDKIVAFVSAGREAYKAKQSKLLDQLRVYDKWRQDGLVQSRVISGVVGCPTQMLEARIGTRVARGTEARDQMYLIILASDARKAYETGTMDPLKIQSK